MDAPSIYSLTAGHIASMKQQRFLVILDLNHAMRATRKFVLTLTYVIIITEKESKEIYNK